MDDDMVNRLSKFKLGDLEDEGIVLERKDVKGCHEEGSRSLFGKIWGSKKVNYTGLKQTFSKLWCPAGDLRVVELGPNFFQFIFSLQAEKDRALLKRPWFFDNQFLILHPWQPKQCVDDERFNQATLWVQVRGIPHYWSSVDVGWRLGKLFYQCLNVIIPESGSSNGRILKLLVEIDLKKPLLRGTRIRLEEEVAWVDFKYEQLPGFCFYCGLVGHLEKSCEQKMLEAKESDLCEGQYGEWLRASGRLGQKKVGLLDKPVQEHAGDAKRAVQEGEVSEGGLEQGGSTRVKEGEQQGHSTILEGVGVGAIENHLPVNNGKSGGLQIVPASGGQGGDNQTTQTSGRELAAVGDSWVDGDMEIELPQGQVNRICLQPLNQNQIDERGNQNMETVVRTEGKWKRVVRQASGGRRETRLENKENEEKTGTKRGLQGAVEEEYEKCALSGKRLKHASDLSDINDVKVGVASLKWPQMSP